MESWSKKEDWLGRPALASHVILRSLMDWIRSWTASW